jgi:hypothetical protein
MRTRRVAVAAAFTLLLSVAAVAHEGHPHRFLGTLSAVQASQIEVKTTDGKTVVFTLDQKTVIQQGRAKADVKELKLGERIVVSALPVAAGKVMTAINVQLRALAPAPATKPATK